MHAAAWKESYIMTEDQNVSLVCVLLHTPGLREISSIFLVKLRLVLPLEGPNISLALVCCCLSIDFVPYISIDCVTAEINGKKGYSPSILSFQPSPATLVHELCWVFMGNVLLQVAPNCLESVLERCHL